MKLSVKHILHVQSEGYQELHNVQICNVVFYPKIASNHFKNLTCLPQFLLKFSSPILEDGMQMSWHC